MNSKRVMSFMFSRCVPLINIVVVRQTVSVNCSRSSNNTCSWSSIVVQIRGNVLIRSVALFFPSVQFSPIGFFWLRFLTRQFTLCAMIMSCASPFSPYDQLFPQGFLAKVFGEACISRLIHKPAMKKRVQFKGECCKFGFVIIPD